MSEQTSAVEILRVTAASRVAASDMVAREEPLEIRVRGQAIAVTMRTPGHDEELAAGFLLTEGILKSRADVVEIAHCQTEPQQRGNILNVFLAPNVEVDLERLTRHVFSASSCGLCGKASIESVHQQFAPIEKTIDVTPEVLFSLAEKLRASQSAFDQTGGVHAAGLFTLDGELIGSREDVGRHNAVDKVLGHAFLNELLPLDKHVLFVSGRASFEIMQKALAARVPIVAAVSAPSSLAVDFARESGQMLYGFVRGATANCYSPK